MLLLNNVGTCCRWRPRTHADASAVGRPVLTQLLFIVLC
jgi:hypothetical protein